ncbi:MAG: hypothetical protein LBC82_02650 [Oscillospiraceae bacterium]|nr:hypothetical protein [Oscillospiraceae bacterium]
MKKPKTEPNLFKQNHNNNYADGRSPSIYCSMCCCASCTGFACPWMKNAGYFQDWYRLGMKFEKRCLLCFKNNEAERIYDCDYYTFYKRRRFFVPRRIRKKKQKIDVIEEKLDLLLKLVNK